MDRHRRALPVVAALFAISVLGMPIAVRSGCLRPSPLRHLRQDFWLTARQVIRWAAASCTITSRRRSRRQGLVRPHIVGKRVDVSVHQDRWPHVGTTVDGGSTFVVQRNGSSCNSSDWSYEVSELPVVADGVVTAFAVDFWRNRCGSFSAAALFGSIRIGSTVPIAMVHTTSSITFPDTYEDTIAPDETSLFEMSARRSSRSTGRS